MKRAIPLLLLVAVGCSTEREYDGAFALPSAATITEPGAETAFSESIAYVANRIGGQIRPLAAESGRFLTDDPTASFFRGSPLPTGQARVITSVAAYTPSPDQLTVYAADQRFGMLLQVPHVVGLDGGFPIEAAVEVSSVRSIGDGAIDELVVHDGFAATETWTFTFNGEGWDVDGSRSGRLEGQATPAEPFTPLGEPFTVTVGGSPDVGDTLSFDTNSGLIEHELSVVPVGLAMAPDQQTLAIAGIADDASAGALLWFDPASEAVGGAVDLPEDSRPIAPVWADEDLWFADAGLDAIWVVPAESTEPIRVDLPFRVGQIAPAPEVGRVYLAVESHLWALDIETLALVDLDPFRAGLNGFPLYSPIRGLAAMPGIVQQSDDDDDGVRRTSRALAISTFSGPVVFYDQELGCLLQDGLGPRTRAATNNNGVARVDHNYNFDGASSGPALVGNESNGNFVSINNCAGIARAEGWRLTFLQAEQAWEVEGTLSGVQERLLYPDVRYVSDGGEFSLLLENGVTPAQEGWSLTFSVLTGVIEISGDQDGDGFVDPNLSEVDFSLPGTPLPVELQLEDTSGGWATTTGTSAVLVPLEGSNAVSRARPDLGLVDAVWR